MNIIIGAEGWEPDPQGCPRDPLPRWLCVWSLRARPEDQHHGVLWTRSCRENKIFNSWTQRQWGVYRYTYKFIKIMVLLKGYIKSIIILHFSSPPPIHVRGSSFTEPDHSLLQHWIQKWVVGVTVAASIQTHGILIPDKHPCMRAKSLVMFKCPQALTQDTTRCSHNIMHSNNNYAAASFLSIRQS